MKLSFCLMGIKGIFVLKEFVREFGAERINWVATEKDNTISNDYYEEIKQTCINNSIPVYDKEQLNQLNADCIIVISWKWLINLRDQKLIIIHDSLLPKYRGFAPLVNMLINGEKIIGVSAIFAEKKFDTGNIIYQKFKDISYPLKIHDAINIINPLYYELTRDIYLTLSEGKILPSLKQNENEATYSLWRDEEDYKIEWHWESQKIERFINAVGEPYSGACTFIDKKKVIIKEATSLDDILIENRCPGKVLFIENEKPIIVCGKGLLRIDNAIDATTKQPILPFKKFRVRLG